MPNLGAFINALKKVVEPVTKGYVADVAAKEIATKSIDELSKDLPKDFAVEKTKQVERLFDRMLKDEKNALGFDEFMVNARSWDERYITDIGQQMGADMKAINDALINGDVKRAIYTTADAFEKKATNNIWETTKIKAQGYIDNESIVALENDATLSTETKIKRLEGFSQKAMSDHRKIAGYDESKYEPGLLTRLFGDLETKLDNALKYAQEAGTPGTAGLLKNLLRLNDRSDAMAKYSRNLLDGMENDFRLLSEDRQMLVREYIEKMDRYSPTEMKAINSNPLASVNEGVWTQPALQQGLGLTEQEVRIANKSMNGWYLLAKKQADMDKGLYLVDDMLPYHKIEERAILRPVNPDGQWSRVSEKDIGISYFHAEANAKHLKEVLAKDNDLAAIIDDLDKKNSYYMASRKKETSDLRLNAAENRMSPADEIKAYKNQYIYHNIKKRGNQILDNAINLSAIPIGTSPKTAKGAAKMMFDIKNSWNSKFEKYIPGDPSKKPTIQKLGETYAEAFADLHVTNALASPKLFIQGNFLQSVLLGGATKGFANELAQTLRVTGNMSKAMFGDPRLMKRLGTDYHGAMNEIMEKAYNGMFDSAPKDTWEWYAKRVFDKFSQRHPELAPTFEQHLESTVLPKQVKFILDLAKLPFQMSDRISRMAGVSASVRHAYPHLLQYQKNLAEGMKPNEAIAQLEKALHFKEFSGIRREFLREYLNVNPNGKAQKASMEEFLTEYADASVKMENFDYGKSGSSYYQDWVRKQNPIVAKAFTFTSFPIYYTRFLSNLGKAYMAGDTAPLLKLAALGTMMTAGSYALAEPDKEKRRIWNEWGAYAVNVAPIISLYNVPNRLVGSTSGIMEPAVSMPFSLGIAGLDEFFKMFTRAEKDGRVLNAISGFRLELERSNKGSPIYRWADENLKEIYKQLGGK